jgi:spermidine synthase
MRAAPSNTTLDAPLPVLSIGVVSGTALAYEVLLTRLFSITQWHNFAYMAISIALLGYAASGTFLALRPRLVARFDSAYVANLLLFGLTLAPAYLLAQRLAVHPEQLLWAPAQLLRVTWVYLLLGLPFFFAANVTALALLRYSARVGNVYGADLLGAGAGAATVVVMLHLVFPMVALQGLALTATGAGLLGALELRTGPAPRRVAGVTLAVLAVAFLTLPGDLFKLEVSPYKSLSQQLNVMDARVLKERSSPLGLLTVVDSPTVPLRYAPGLSLGATVDVPEQLGVFVDADAIMPLISAGPPERLQYLDQMTSALPYHLGDVDDVLVLGAGAGSLVHQARFLGASSVAAVEVNGQLARLVREDYRAFAGPVFDQDGVTLYVDEARGHLARSEARFDLVQVALVDAFGASSGGLRALSEEYLYTVEALTEYYAHLAPGGYLAVTRWIKLPLRDSLKLFATALAALRAAGVPDPASQLLVIRGWQTSTLVVRRGPFSPAEIDRATAFAEARGFDVAWYRDMPATLANRFNRLPTAQFYDGATLLASDGADAFVRDYKFNLTPATDDRPYFSNFFKWSTLPELLSLSGEGGIPLLESGYLIVVATLLQALVLGLLIVVLPLWHRLRRVGDAGARALPLVLLFASLGIAFLFIEIAFIQKFLLFLHRPVLAVAAVLSGFLVFAGVGSRIAARCPAHRAPQLIAIAVTSIAVLGALYVWVLPAAVFAPLLAAPFAVRLLVSLVLIALIAIPMGMPFPLGLAQLSTCDVSLIPVAWAINGCASVISAVLATLLATEAGFSAVVLIAVGLYGAAAISARMLVRSPPAGV